MSCALKLGDLIEALKNFPDKNKVLPCGFNKPHSWRGIYEELAFEPAENITVFEMLSAAESAVGTVYQGWKGGDFKMDLDSPVHLSKEGNSDDFLGAFLLHYMLGWGIKERCKDCHGWFAKPTYENHTRVQCLETQLNEAREYEKYSQKSK